jgi:hypothetical protein
VNEVILAVQSNPGATGVGVAIFVVLAIWKILDSKRKKGSRGSGGKGGGGQYPK